MGKADEARAGALAVLVQGERTGEAVERALNRHAQAMTDARDRASMRRLVYGVLENRRYLDAVLDTFSARPMAKQKGTVRNILRLALYELYFLETPPHAAVDQAVSLVPKKEQALKRYVNAVLRSLLRGGDKAKELPLADRLKRLAVRYSVPDWMAKYLALSFSESEWERLLAKQNEPAPISLFVSPDQSREALYTSLAPFLSGLRFGTISSHCLLCNSGMVTDTEAFREGKITIQSQAGVRAAEMTVEGIQEGEILDLCAAPGGKSVAMKLLAPSCRIVANDVVEEKRRYMEENAARMHAPLEIHISDARVFQAEWENRFDAVLVDAPCSGLGLLGRKPDIRWNRREEDIETLARLQKEILQTALRYVKPGGRLVYSTCTYGRKENEEVISTLPTNWKPEPMEGKSVLRYSPLVEHSDGFFIARFRRPTADGNRAGMV